ncbi:hypothetical protein E1B28_005796 [Marasmius oreades]|uniref:Uncharacterized protein n=1 Tax=Marasmius oreades TaxID=181124 RepID=A0A9P7S4L4_9AGAR|nr:uncharacterized protein E1B28_005796 [Marasmius oreades]KAG7095002.1 hypothetical protein E1B28_005796 [Marasmius oreades]
MSHLPVFSFVEGSVASVYQALFLLFITVRQYVLEHIDVFAPIGILQIVLLSWICAVIFTTAFLLALRRIVKLLRSQWSRSSRRKHDYEYDLEMCEDGHCEEHRTEAIPVYLAVGQRRSLSLGKSVNRKGGQYQFGVLVPVMIERNDRFYDD